MLLPTRGAGHPGGGGDAPFCKVHARCEGAAYIRRPGYRKTDSFLKGRNTGYRGNPGPCHGPYEERKTVKVDHVLTVVLDEADEMLNMGFLEDMETILSQLPEERQTLMFSATMPQAIAEIARKFQKDPVTVRVIKKELTVPKVTQYY